MEKNPAAVPLEQIQEGRNLSIGRLLLRGTRDFQARSLKKLHTLGYHSLTLTHTNVLVHLDIKGTRIITLAERSGITKQSMGQLVQELEEQGYVTRTVDPTDRRAVLITFTETGQQFLQDAHRIKQEIEAEYSAILGEEGLAALRTLLLRLTETSQQEMID